MLGWAGGPWTEGFLLSLTFSSLLQSFPGPMALGMVSQGQRTECRSWKRGRAIQGLGRNHLDFLQGMGRKHQCTPKQQFQALKEMVGNECLEGEPW